jgi:hypothetical protein
MIHLTSTTEPYLDTTGKLNWTPLNAIESDIILKIDWNLIHLISFREGEPKVEKQHKDLSLLKSFTGKDGKKYVLLSDVENLDKKKYEV